MNISLNCLDMAKIKSKAYGKKIWSGSAGYIPLYSTGVEPRFTSNDRIAMLNTGKLKATILLTIFYEDREPVDRYELEVKPGRVRKIKFNDLIDPLPIPLQRPYGLKLESDEKIIVQFSKTVTAGKNIAGFISTPYAARKI